MKKSIVSLTFVLFCLTSVAQDTFHCTLYDNANNLYFIINFYDKDVTLSGQDFMGKMDGYLGDYEDYRKWLILNSQLTSPDVAEFDMINLEGSEDLHATLTHNADDTYTLRQGSGSTLKIARRGKWVKLPKSITLTTTREKNH